MDKKSVDLLLKETIKVIKEFNYSDIPSFEGEIECRVLQPVLEDFELSDAGKYWNNYFLGKYDGAIDIKKIKIMDSTFSKIKNSALELDIAFTEEGILINYYLSIFYIGEGYNEKYMDLNLYKEKVSDIVYDKELEKFKKLK